MTSRIHIILAGTGTERIIVICKTTYLLRGINGRQSGTCQDYRCVICSIYATKGKAYIGCKFYLAVCIVENNKSSGGSDDPIQ